MINIETSFTTLFYRSPVPVRGRMIDHNCFLKVRVLEVDYYLSLLPGLHQATLEEINLKVKSFFSHYDLDFKSIDFGVKFFNLISPQDVFLDSIKDECLFNIEAILLCLIQKTHPQLFTHDAVALNLLYNNKDGTQFYLDADCIKIKINPENVQKTIQVINELYQLHPEMIYRLDGNKKFELDELIEFEQSLKKGIPAYAFSKIDYIEEPFKNFYDTFLFRKRSGLTIAIDESYKSYMANKDLIFPAVIKPSLIGISPVFSWLRSHQDNRAIISSCFEHPSISLALNFLARQRPNEFHGLENFLSLS